MQKTGNYHYTYLSLTLLNFYVLRFRVQHEQPGN